MGPDSSQKSVIAAAGCGTTQTRIHSTYWGINLVDIRLDSAWPLAVVATGIFDLVYKQKANGKSHSDNRANPEEQASGHPSTGSRQYRNKSWWLVVLALVLSASHARAEDAIRNQFGVRSPMRDGVNLS